MSKLKELTGYIVDEDGLLIDPYQDNQLQIGHHNHAGVRATGNRLVHAESTKSHASDNSLEDSAIGRSLYRDNSMASHVPNPNNRDQSNQYKVMDVDLDAIEVIDEDDLHQLPDAVNREILKNSREIVYEEDPRSGLGRDESFVSIKSSGSRKNMEIFEATRPGGSGRRHFVRYPLPEEDKRSLNGSRRNLSSRNLQEDDKRSLNGSRRNLSSRRVPAPVEKAESLHGSARNLVAGSRENLIGARRHTGSKELLTSIKRTVPVAKGAKEAKGDSRPRRKASERSGENPKIEVEIDMEGSSRQNTPPNLQQVALASYLSPSDLSPESGIVEGSSPEATRRNLRLPTTSVIARNRRSYEHAQLQDVNEAMTRTVCGSSSSDSEDSTKTSIPLVIVPGKSNTPGGDLGKQNISYTSV